MPIIFTLILSFFITGCVNQNQANIDINSTKSKLPTIDSLPISPQITMVEERTPWKNDKSISPDISGAYELEEGMDHNTNISKAYMVIEKLDNLNYGYYYAIKDGEAVANSSFGIFRYREGTFLNKVLDGKNITTLNHNITIIAEGQRLKLIVVTSFGKKNIIWSRVLEDNKREDKELSEAIKDAKISYTQIYKEKFDTFIEKEGH